MLGTFPQKENGAHLTLKCPSHERAGPGPGPGPGPGRSAQGLAERWDGLYKVILVEEGDRILLPLKRISGVRGGIGGADNRRRNNVFSFVIRYPVHRGRRSEEHTSELQSR